MKKLIRNIYRRRVALKRVITSNAYVIFTTDTDIFEDGYINHNIRIKDAKRAAELIIKQMDYNEGTEALNYVKELLKS